MSGLEKLRAGLVTRGKVKCQCKSSEYPCYLPYMCQGCARTGSFPVVLLCPSFLLSLPCIVGEGGRLEGAVTGRLALGKRLADLDRGGALMGPGRVAGGVSRTFSSVTDTKSSNLTGRLTGKTGGLGSISLLSALAALSFFPDLHNSYVKKSFGGSGRVGETKSAVRPRACGVCFSSYLTFPYSNAVSTVFAKRELSVR